MWWLWGKWRLHWERRWAAGGDQSRLSASASWYWHLAECWTGCSLMKMAGRCVGVPSISTVLLW